MSIKIHVKSKELHTLCTDIKMPDMPEPNRCAAIIMTENTDETTHMISDVIFDELEEFNAYVPNDNQKAILYQKREKGLTCQCLRRGRKYVFGASNIDHAIAEVIGGNMIEQSEKRQDEILEDMKKTKNWGMVSEKLVRHVYEDGIVLFESPFPDFFVFDHVEAIVVKTRELLDHPDLLKTGKTLIFWEKKDNGMTVTAEKLGEGKYSMIADPLERGLALFSDKFFMQMIDKAYEK